MVGGIQRPLPAVARGECLALEQRALLLADERHAGHAQQRARGGVALGVALGAHGAEEAAIEARGVAGGGVAAGRAGGPRAHEICDNIFCLKLFGFMVVWERCEIYHKTTAFLCYY